MAKMHWLCLSREYGNGPLGHAVQNVSIYAAALLYYGSERSMSFTSQIGDGYIETDRKQYTIGGQVGIVFKAAMGDEIDESHLFTFLMSEDALREAAAILHKEGSLTFTPGEV